MRISYILIISECRGRTNVRPQMAINFHDRNDERIYQKAPFCEAFRYPHAGIEKRKPGLQWWYMNTRTFFTLSAVTVAALFGSASVALAEEGTTNQPAGGPGVRIKIMMQSDVQGQMSEGNGPRYEGLFDGNASTTPRKPSMGSGMMRKGTIGSTTGEMMRPPKNGTSEFWSGSKPFLFRG